MRIVLGKENPKKKWSGGGGGGGGAATESSHRLITLVACISPGCLIRGLLHRYAPMNIRLGPLSIGILWSCIYLLHYIVIFSRFRSFTLFISFTHWGRWSVHYKSKSKYCLGNFNSVAANFQLPWFSKVHNLTNLLKILSLQKVFPEISRLI